MPGTPSILDNINFNVNKMNQNLPQQAFERGLNGFKHYQDSINKSLNDKSKPWYGAFDYLEKKSTLPKIYLFFGAAVFCALYLIFGYGAQLLCNIVGVVYPAYISIHAIETSSKDDDTRWLTYWVTFAIMSIIEYFSGILTSIVPFYWLLKCIFLVWCMLPIQTNGSSLIYARIVRPYFLKHHKAADKLIDDVFNKARQSADSVLKGD